MSPLLLYGLLLKATVTSFAGLGSLPQIRQDFVETHHLLTNDQLAQAVLIGRSTPGPVGTYVVAVGYLAAGWSGAVAGWLALVTPALLVIPLLAAIERWLHLPRVRAAVDAVVIASAALLVVSGTEMAVDVVRQLARMFGVM